MTVVATDTGTADALATVVGVAGLDHPGVGTLLATRGAAAPEVDAAGVVQPSPRWRDQVVFEPGPSG